MKCAIGDELKHNCWSKLQDDVAIVRFEGIIICCLCCCVMILVNLCHNGLSMMYAEATHTRWPREPCNVLTLMVGTNEKDWTICFVGLIWWSSVDPKECLWDQTHFYWLGMCLTRRLRQGCESRALWILTSQFQSESISGMMPVTDHFDERMVLQLQCMEYCNWVRYISISIWFDWSVAMLKTPAMKPACLKC